MKCDICAEYIYANDWFPKNDLKICKKCFEGSTESAPNNKRNINNFNHNNNMKIDQLKENAKGIAIQKIYHDLSDINIEDIDDKKLTIEFHGIIKNLLNNSQLSSHDKVTLLKQLTLDSIYSVLTQVIDNLEEKNKKRFQEKYK